MFGVIKRLALHFVVGLMSGILSSLLLFGFDLSDDLVFPGMMRLFFPPVLFSIAIILLYKKWTARGMTFVLFSFAAYVVSDFVSTVGSLSMGSFIGGNSSISPEDLYLWIITGVLGSILLVLGFRIALAKLSLLHIVGLVILGGVLATSVYWFPMARRVVNPPLYISSATGRPAIEPDWGTITLGWGSPEVGHLLIVWQAGMMLGLAWSTRNKNG